MSAAATAAGYLYASGRLRGRAAKDQEQGVEQRAEQQQPAHKEKRVKVHVERAPKPEAPRVAVYPQEEKPRRTPKIEYRRKRWTPE
jgi:hypothetical protein